MKHSIARSMAALCVVWIATSVADSTNTPAKPTVDSDGTVRIPAFSVPLSRYMSEEAKRKFIAEARQPSLRTPGEKQSIAERRADVDDFYRPIVERARARYPVSVEDKTIAGVPTQVVIPKEGIAPRNKDRVLINLHGGGFVTGAGPGGLAESVPIAGAGKIKVISVDYRMAPEHHFPAASQDVTTVYSDLLKRYKPENIGIYGCSAGGILSAMSAAWLQKKNLPTPGAIGIFSAGAYASFSGSPANPNTWGGDSAFTGPPLVGGAPRPSTGQRPNPVSSPMDYTANVDKNDPLASPALSENILARFPPTLLITGTRAWDMSAAVQTHRLLSKVGTPTDLHLWDGMGHCFFFDVNLPESQEAYAVITRFFEAHLGRSAQ